MIIHKQLIFERCFRYFIILELTGRVGGSNSNNYRTLHCLAISDVTCISPQLLDPCTRQFGECRMGMILASYNINTFLTGILTLAPCHRWKS